MNTDFVDVTEIAGDKVSREQVERLCHRYYWAGEYCRDKDVVEVACGTGQGLGYLHGLSRSLIAGDYSQKIVDMACRHYGDRIAIEAFDAQSMPFNENSFDVILIFEALYYLPEPERFFSECARVLRPNGKLLIANANKDLSDFNPSPHSCIYHGVLEMGQSLRKLGFRVDFFGHLPIHAVSWRQKLLRPIKWMAVKSGLMPKTMAGKKLLKRVVFGELVNMPEEISAGMFHYTAPTEIPGDRADRTHKVIYCEATLAN